MSEVEEWWLKEMPPSVTVKGPYDVTVCATRFNGNSSGCSWEIRKETTFEVLQLKSKRSVNKKSNEQRGYVAAAIGAISACQPQSSITIWSNSEYLTKGLKEWAPEWRRDGWLKSDGKPPKNVELWNRLLKLIEERQLMVIPIYEAKEMHIPYDRVMAWAKQAQNNSGVIGA